MVFEVFRSRQRELLVALTLLAMFAFVFAGMLDQVMNREFGDDPVVATAWGQDITARQVQMFQHDRNLANQFFYRAAQRVNMERPFQLNPSAGDALRSIVILEKANAMGIVIDDSMVTEFINQETGNRLSKGDFLAVLSGKDMEGAAPLSVSERELYRILAQELKIMRAVLALTPPVLLDTPYELWADRELADTKVQLQVATVPVTKFTDAVGEPTEEQLKKIYDQYKNQAADPKAGVVGFLTPHKVDAQYLVAKVDDFVSKVTVTPEEVKKYYDEHPEEFLPEPPKPPATTPAEGEAAPTPPPEEGAAPEETPAPPKDADQPKEESPTEPSAPENPAGEKPAEEAKTEEKPAEEPKPEEKQPETGETPQAATLRSLVTTVTATGTYLLAQEEKTEPPATEAKSEDAPAATEAPAAPPAEKAEEPKSETPAAAEKSAAPATAEAPAVPEAAPGQEPPKVDAPSAPRPFEEVKAEIEKKLLRKKASDYIVGNMQQVIRQVMQPYLDKYLEAHNAFDEKKAADKKFAPPPQPDLEKVASEYGYSLKSTGLITQEQAEAIEGLADASRPQRADDLPFDIAVFDQKVFRPRVVQSQDENDFYLYWKTEDQPAKAPAYDEVKDQVLAAWRTEAAGPKAKEAADKLAEAARAEGANFDTLAKEAGVETTTTDPFTRYISQPAPMIGQQAYLPPVIPQLPNAGPEMLNEIFKMKEGEIKVVSDPLQQNYYVVKLLSRKEPEFNNFVQHYSLEVGLLRDPSFLAQRREFLVQYEITRRSIENESNLDLTPIGYEFFGATPPGQPASAETPANEESPSAE